LLSGTETLTADTQGPDAVSVAFQISPAGAQTWQTISTDTTDPWRAGFNTKSVADGTYDLRAVASDAQGNQGIVTDSGIQIDNSAPKVSSSTPADGATLASANSIQLELSELATPGSVKLDGNAVASAAI